MVEQERLIIFPCHEVVEDGGVALSHRNIVLGVRDDPLRLERRPDDDVRHVVGQVALFEVIQAGPVVQIPRTMIRAAGSRTRTESM